jgi:hypothetical protein
MLQELIQNACKLISDERKALDKEKEELLETKSNFLFYRHLANSRNYSMVMDKNWKIDFVLRD